MRQAEGMSQVDFAKKLGISKRQLCDIEKRRKFDNQSAGLYNVPVMCAMNRSIHILIRGKVVRADDFLDSKAA
jgi:hypothetical protein